MTTDAVPTRRAFAEERQAEPDCGSLVRFSRRASCIHWALGERWRLAPTIAKLTFREGLAAGGNRVRTIGPASGKVVDAKFQRSDPGRSNTDSGRSAEPSPGGQRHRTLGLAE